MMMMTSWVRLSGTLIHAFQSVGLGGGEDLAAVVP
jgi:hypothetical protein